MGASLESTSGGDSEPFDVELEFEKWQKGELAAILSKDKEFSVRSDPWANDVEPDSDLSASGRDRVPGEVSSEAAAVLGKSGTRASFPVTPSEASGVADEAIKVEVPAQDHSGTGIEVLTLLSEVDKKKAFEKAQAKQTWWGAFVYETCRYGSQARATLWDFDVKALVTHQCISSYQLLTSLLSRTKRCCS